MNDAEGYAQFDQVMRDFEQGFRALVNAASEGALWRIARIFDDAKSTRYCQRLRLAQLVLERSYRAEWEGIKRDHEDTLEAFVI